MNILDTPAAWRSGTRPALALGEQPLELRGRARDIQPHPRAGFHSPDAVEIPFEAQQQQAGQRMCGAAALAMVLRALRVPCSQAELWSEIAYPDCQGELAARTFQLATAALHRGIPALVIQARDPWQALRQFLPSVPGLILNHRLEAGAEQGHFTVLLDMNDTFALVHDPLWGPRRVVSKAMLETLWQPASSLEESTEVMGNILVGLGPRARRLDPCAHCAAPLPAVAACGVCGNQFPLQPAALLGCMRGSCSGCRWEQMFCPFCDAAFKPLG